MNDRLNAICPYFAMFPLNYPSGIVGETRPVAVLDPFCGRGTTNMAARLAGIRSVGVDSSPVAYAIASAKMVGVSPSDIVSECRAILASPRPDDIPQGEFWTMMYSPRVLEDVCRLRSALLDDCSSPERIALRGIALGALHGPMRIGGTSSYFSNQFPRTYASKPRYSVRYWKSKGFLRPPEVSVEDIVSVRAARYYSDAGTAADGFVLRADSTRESTFEEIMGRTGLFDSVITSPPYLGMPTYIPDQWLRNWFVGGPPDVEYTRRGQIREGKDTFIRQLREVWRNCAGVCSDGAGIHIRFGRLGAQSEDPAEVLFESLEGTGWSDPVVRDAGQPGKGRRQSDSFKRSDGRYTEIDISATLA